MKRIEMKAIKSIETGFEDSHYFIAINVNDYAYKRLFTRKDKRDKHFDRILSKINKKYNVI